MNNAITTEIAKAQCTVRGGVAIRYALRTIIGPDSFEDWSCHTNTDNSNVIVFTGDYDYLFFTITVNTVTGVIEHEVYNAEAMWSDIYTYKTNDDLSVKKISEALIDYND